MKNPDNEYAVIAGPPPEVKHKRPKTNNLLFADRVPAWLGTRAADYAILGTPRDGFILVEGAYKSDLRTVSD